MKKIETLLVGVGLLAALVVVSGAFWHYGNRGEKIQAYDMPTTRYGAFLAAQHAIYVNDFDVAALFSAQLNDTDAVVVMNTKLMSEFLSGKLPDDAKLLQQEKAAASQLIYDAYLVSNANWDELYKRHKSDESTLSAPLRIWASVATKRTSEALKFIDKLPTNTSWKAFARGSVHAITGNADKAATEFANVRPEFMNINDYMYIMSFYRHNNMDAAAEKLRTEFTARPGGMFMLDYDFVPEWSQYSGFANSLAFSLIQNVSHTQAMMYSDLAILLLRFAQITGPDFGNDNDAINYYIGQYFFNNNGDYKRYYEKISLGNPFYQFAVLRMAEKSGDISQLKQTLNSHPLFVPAVNKVVAHHIKHGDKRAALRTINRALNTTDLSDEGHAFFLKSRAHIYFVFGDLNNALSDIHAAADVLPIDGEIMSLQAKIWAAQNREIENAYEYAMELVKRNPSDIFAWDTLGCVVAAREGVDAALDVLERVGEVANTCSSLFERLGDLYLADGDEQRARDAYLRAIDLSDDGLVIVPNIQKKLRKLK